MNWLNIQTTTLDSEAFVGSDPVARGFFKSYKQEEEEGQL